MTASAIIADLEARASVLEAEARLLREAAAALKPRSYEADFFAQEPAAAALALRASIGAAPSRPTDVRPEPPPASGALVDINARLRAIAEVERVHKGASADRVHAPWILRHEGRPYFKATLGFLLDWYARPFGDAMMLARMGKLLVEPEDGKPFELGSDPKLLASFQKKELKLLREKWLPEVAEMGKVKVHPSHYENGRKAAVPKVVKPPKKRGAAARAHR